MEDCSICGITLDDKFKIELNCNHIFHYECIMKSFKHNKNTECPYCRKKNGLLPIVNGLNKPISGIHYWGNDKITNTSTGCEGILKSGKNKGKQCNKKCKLGYNYCLFHLPKKHK